MANLLIYIQRPARLVLGRKLPDKLLGLIGGFRPLGLWDYIFDSRSREWCGIQYYLSKKVAESFQSANPRLDDRLVVIRAPDPAVDGSDAVKYCSANGTTHLIQVIWSRFDKPEIMPALEAMASWYASSGPSPTSDAQRFQPGREFAAVEILGFGSIGEDVGLILPRKFIAPLDDQRQNA